MLQFLVFLILFYGMCCTSMAQQNIGFSRLFSTTQQRLELDVARQRLLQGLAEPKQEEEVDLQVENAQTLRELLVPRVKFNGMLIRKDGNTDFWVNGIGSNSKSELGAELRDSSKRQGKKIKLRLPNDKEIELLPGQIYSFKRGKKFEGYQDSHSVVAQKAQAKAAELLTVTNAEAKPAEALPAVFDESFLINEIQKIHLLEQRLKELEGSKPTE